MWNVIYKSYIDNMKKLTNGLFSYNLEFHFMYDNTM
jgi:hypothetical protein